MLEETISKNIKRFRKRNRMTLQDLADRTGLTKGYLSKIERSLKFPPFSTLNGIAEALGTDVTALFREGRAKRKPVRLTFTKKNQGKIVKTLGAVSGYTFRVLSHEKPGKNMIPYIIEPAFEEKEVFQHEGEEFIYVLEGEHEFVYDGEKYLMETGDSVYFDAGVPHTGRSVGSRKAKLLSVLYNYKRL